MASTPITPEVTAEVDQALAGASTQLDSLIQAYQEQVAQYGAVQGMANVCLALSQSRSSQITGLLMAALARLARNPA